MNIENLKNATLIPSVEDPNKMYLCIGDIRHVFEEGKYVGWYHP